MTISMERPTRIHTRSAANIGEAEATRARWAARLERVERILAEGRIHATAGSGEYAVEKPFEEQHLRAKKPKRPHVDAVGPPEDQWAHQRERPHEDVVRLADDRCGCDEHEEYGNCEHKIAVKRYVRQAILPDLGGEIWVFVDDEEEGWWKL